MKKYFAIALLILGAQAAFTAGAAAPGALVKIRLAPMPGIGHFVPDVARGLGYFKAEGLDVEYVNVMNHIDEDWLSGELLNNGKVDAEICWFQRVHYGIGNGQPLRAVFMIEHSPHMNIYVANRVKDQIKSAADFRGRNIIDSDGFSTKRYLTDLVIKRNGVAIDAYTPHPEWSHTAAEAIKAVREGKADIVTSMEPQTAKIVASGLVTELYDLTTEAGTRKALGELWPARVLYFSPQYIAAHPDRVQKLVNAFTRAMRYINTHTPQQIMAVIDPGYFAPDISNDKWAEYKAGKIDEIVKAYPIFSRGDYSFPPSSAKLLFETVKNTYFDDSGEGKYRRAGAQSPLLKLQDTYDNRFVLQAMARIK